MFYYARFEADPEGGFIVTFPEFPEAITGGTDMAEAMANAQDALEVVLLTYVENETEIPEQSVSTGVPVFVSAVVAVKIAFIQAFHSSKITRVALAQRLGKQETEIRRMLDPYHQTKLSSMEAGLLVLGKQLVVSVQDAA
jgi:antitoxin HicB